MIYKEYNINIEQTEKGFSMNRENKGFTVFELIGFMEFINSELLLQAKSMFDETDIKRTINGSTGKLSIDFTKPIEVKEDD